MRKTKPEKRSLARKGPAKENWIVYVSTFPPRKCGIATFTEDLTRAMDDLLAPAIKSKIVAMNRDDVAGYHYPRKVILQINQDRDSDYLQAARSLNRREEVRLINIQHEFGIFGGEWGSKLIPFLKALKKPSVITFHTVLPDPSEKLRTVVQALAEYSGAVTVMTQRSKMILQQEYGIAPEKIRVIPHGIHSAPYTTSKQAKKALGFADRTVLSTFGLLGRGKGLEYVIEALPEVVKRFPKVIYLIFGATHPTVLKEEGESYRNGLIQKVHDLGLKDHVKFYNKYFSLNQLLRNLRATDIYISPSLDPNQATSGTLSYALGMGKPVISTAFAQAKEDITDEVGLLVDFRNPPAYTEAICRLLEDEQWQQSLGRNAYFRTRNRTWPNVAIQYSKLFAEHAASMAEIIKRKSFPRIKLDHLIRLTDDFGIVQFAKLTEPDFASGYTLDDNSRALVVISKYLEHLGKASKSISAAQQKRKLWKLAHIYLDFIAFVARPDACFDNYVTPDRTLDHKLNRQSSLEDANARALHALATATISTAMPMSIRRQASRLLKERIVRGCAFDSPRAIAIYAKALAVLLRGRVRAYRADIEQLLREQCDKLVALYRQNSSADWPWFEGYLTYSNAVLPEALLLGYRHIGTAEYLKIGKATLDFLIRESFREGLCLPVGQEGWYPKNGTHNHYDQQPEEVCALIYALRTAYQVTHNKTYLDLMYRAFNWFLGDNTLNQVVYDQTTGGCYDGVERRSINLNQGAESTISYLLARLAFHEVESPSISSRKKTS